MMGIGTGVRIFAAIAVLTMLGLFLHYVKQAGYDEATAIWEARENKRVADVARRTKALQDAARAAEQKGAADVADAAGAATKEKANVQAKHDRFVDDVMAGRIRVFTTPAGDGSGDSRLSTSGAGVRGEAAAGTLELPRKTLSDLGLLARDADQIAVDLNECRAILRSERGK